MLQRKPKFMEAGKEWIGENRLPGEKMEGQRDEAVECERTASQGIQ